MGRQFLREGQHGGFVGLRHQAEFDIAKPVTLKVANFVCGEHPSNKKPMCGAEATATIMRSDWGMKYALPKSVSDEIKLIIPIEAYRE